MSARWSFAFALAPTSSSLSLAKASALSSSRAAKASSRDLKGSTVASICRRLSWTLIARSFVVPATTAIFLPVMSESERRPEAVLISSPVVSTKITLEKSTSFMRVSVIVLEPHSMSARPLATDSKRDCSVTGTQLTFRPWMPSWRSIELTMRLHRSIEKPMGSFLSPVKENGMASAR